MSNNLPINAAQMRSLLSQALEQSKESMVTRKDKLWIEAEIDRYNDQTSMLKDGIKSKMLPLGITRKVDELGRYVIPKEVRRLYDINEGDPMEIFIDEVRGMVVLQKYTPGCHLCGQSIDEEPTIFHGKRVCENCLNELFNTVLS